MFNKKNKKTSLVAAAYIATVLLGGYASVQHVYADNTAPTIDTEILPVIEVSSADLNPQETIKHSILQERSQSLTDMDYKNIDIGKTKLILEGFDRNLTGIQQATARVTLVNKDADDKTLGYSFIQKVLIKVVTSTAPVIKLKSDSVTVNNGDTWNASNYISYINDDSGVLPALTITGNVDMATDGNYTVLYTVVDTTGNKSFAQLNVTVKTPQEVIDNKIEEERRAKENEKIQAAKQALENSYSTSAFISTAQLLADADEVWRDYVKAGLITDHPTGDTGNNYSFSQCTWWVYIRRHQLGLTAGSLMGNGNQWANTARSLGYTVSNTPMVGDVMVFAAGQEGSDGYYGHVAIVEAITTDGSVITSECGASRNGQPYSRVISDPSRFEYIHY